jgi:hypothetical protein
VKFPIVLKTEAAVPPPGQLYYEVAENGVFQVRETPLYRAVIRVHDGIPGLLPGAEELLIKFPRVPASVLGEVLAFFDEVYRRWEGEAVVILFYCARRREYRAVAPPQTIPGRWRHDGRWRADLAVRYEHVARPGEFVRFGTIHSHADLAAYSSGLDCDDERYEDGLHVVFGDFHRQPLSVAAAFVAGGVRFRVAPDDVLEDWRIPPRAARPDWMAQMRLEDRSAGARSPCSPGAASPLAAVAVPGGGYADRCASAGAAGTNGADHVAGVTFGGEAAAAASPTEGSRVEGGAGNDDGESDADGNAEGDGESDGEGDGENDCGHHEDA